MDVLSGVAGVQMSWIDGDIVMSGAYGVRI